MQVCLLAIFCTCVIPAPWLLWALRLLPAPLQAPPFNRHDPPFHSTPQVSEDHCWLQLGHGQRETTVEVTTDTAAKRGLPVAPDAWRGWLYTGGRAVLCSPHQALAALVTSINPSVSGGKKGVSAVAPVPLRLSRAQVACRPLPQAGRVCGHCAAPILRLPLPPSLLVARCLNCRMPRCTLPPQVDSEELQLAQKRLLEVLLRRQPAALYPAALCALADLAEVGSI